MLSSKFENINTHYNNTIVHSPDVIQFPIDQEHTTVHANAPQYTMEPVEHDANHSNQDTMDFETGFGHNIINSSLDEEMSPEIIDSENAIQEWNKSMGRPANEEKLALVSAIMYLYQNVWA